MENVITVVKKHKSDQTAELHQEKISKEEFNTHICDGKNRYTKQKNIFLRANQ